MNEINAFATEHGLSVIEDAAQSFGATYHGRRSGALSIAGVTSFFPSKPLGCYGDGGAVFTDDDHLAEVMREVRVHGQSGRYHHTRIGINGRLDTLQCAILIPKLERFSWELERRDHVARRYLAGFAPLKSKGVVLPELKADRTSAWAQYTLQGQRSPRVSKVLRGARRADRGPLPQHDGDQPAYQNNGRALDVSTARRLSQTVVSLPLFPDMTDAQADYVIETVTGFLTRLGRQAPAFGVKQLGKELLRHRIVPGGLAGHLADQLAGRRNDVRLGQNVRTEEW